MPAPRKYLVTMKKDHGNITQFGYYWVTARNADEAETAAQTDSDHHFPGEWAVDPDATVLASNVENPESIAGFPLDTT